MPSDDSVRFSLCLSRLVLDIPAMIYHTLRAHLRIVTGVSPFVLLLVVIERDRMRSKRLPNPIPTTTAVIQVRGTGGAD